LKTLEIGRDGSEVEREVESENEGEDETEDRSDHNISLKNSPFDYAVSYWLKHAMDVPPGPQSTSLSRALWERVRDFFWDRDGAIFVEWLRIFSSHSDSWHMKDSSVRCLGDRETKAYIASGLHVAASYGLLDIFRWAHPNGLDFEMRDRAGETPLMSAAQMGDEDIGTVLLDTGVDINSIACTTSVSERDCDGECGADGWTALAYAGFHRRPEMMKFLLKQPGIEVDRLSHGNTALGVMITHGRNSEMELLVGAGAKLAMYEGKVVEIPSTTKQSN
jgi:hypothetical protein